MTGPRLSARRRVELALIGAMLYRAASVAFERDSALREQGMPADNARCLECLKAAAHEPFADEPDPVARAKLVRRIERASLAALGPYEERPVATVFAVLLYWLDGMLRAGHLELIEGSAGAEGIQALITMLQEEHADLMAAVDRSARKQVPKFAAHLARLGYFVEARAIAA